MYPANRRALTILAVYFPFVSFSCLAALIRSGPTSFDLWVVQNITLPVGGRDFAREFWEAATVLGSGPVVTLLLVLVIGYLLLSQRIKAGLAMGAVVLIAALCTYFLKGWFARPRPSELETLLSLDQFSFPSGHSSASGATYPMLGALLARMSSSSLLKFYFWGCGIGLMLLIGISRLVLGVHYLTDVLAGWSIGLGASALGWVVWRRFQQAGVVEPEPVDEGIQEHSEDAPARPSRAGP